MFKFVGSPASQLPNELDKRELKSYPEGAKKQIIVNAYERNNYAREKCLGHYGYKCRSCTFDFEAKYGEQGKEFIHVHHVVPISSIGQNYQVDPIKDLIPVCPNCHAMIHRYRKNTLTVDELKKILNQTASTV
ncbi:MAG: restriction endonuclease [Gemmatimonadetes bacterium]|nr:restriction endonuclease [Gemmatimonadota bacterium]